MSWEASNWAQDQVTGKVARKCLLMLLANCHNAHTDECVVSQTELAATAEMSVDSVARHLKALEADGIIRRVERFTKGGLRLPDGFELVGIEGFLRASRRGRGEAAAAPGEATAAGGASEKPQNTGPRNLRGVASAADEKPQKSGPRNLQGVGPFAGGTPRSGAGGTPQLCGGSKEDDSKRKETKARAGAREAATGQGGADPGGAGPEVHVAEGLDPGLVTAWRTACAALLARIGPARWAAWMDPAVLVRAEAAQAGAAGAAGARFTLEAPTGFAADYLQREFGAPLEAALARALGLDLRRVRVEAHAAPADDGDGATASAPRAAPRAAPQAATGG